MIIQLEEKDKQVLLYGASVLLNFSGLSTVLLGFESADLKCQTRKGGMLEEDKSQTTMVFGKVL